MLKSHLSMKQSCSKLERYYSNEHYSMLYFSHMQISIIRVLKTGIGVKELFQEEHVRALVNLIVSNICEPGELVCEEDILNLWGIKSDRTHLVLISQKLTEVAISECVIWFLLTKDRWINC